MTRSVVAIVRCPDYRPESLDEAMERLQEFIGGFGGLIKPKEAVFLKINHLGNHKTDLAINTHPELVASFARSISGITTNVTVADGLDTPDSSPFETTGFSRVCREAGLELVNFCRQGYVSVTLDNPYCMGRVPIATIAREAGFVVTVPKLKTHMLTLVTGAVKNNYGYLPHEVRLRLHREHIIPADFAGAVTDVFAACKPGLTVMDAIDALEGSGPSTGGRPRHLGLLIAGTDAVAVDAVSSAVVGLDPMEVATTRLAHERGYGVGDLSQIEVVGSSIEEVRCRNFAKPVNQVFLGSLLDRMPRSMSRGLARVFRVTRQWPEVSPERCTGCGMCATHCPQDTIDMTGGKAWINYDECIACFCCLEYCPSNAIRPRRSVAGGVLSKCVRGVERGARAAGKLFLRRRR